MPTDPKKRLQRKRFIRRRIERNQERVRRVLTDAKRSIDSRILKAANDGRTLTSATLRNLLYRDVGKLYVEMGGNIDEWNKAMVNTTAKEGFNFASADIPKASRQTWDKFSRAHVDDYLAYVHPQNAPGMVAVASRLAEQDIRFLRRQYVDVFRAGSVSGATIRDMQKELKSRMTGTRPDWKFIDSAGRAWKPDNYFNMLARTTVANVERESYADTMTDAGLDLVMVAGGQPTAPPPDPCWEWYGKILSLTGETKGYPTVAEAEASGLYHPNCIHYHAAVLPDEVEEFKEREQVADATRDEAAEADLKAEKESKKAQGAKPKPKAKAQKLEPAAAFKPARTTEEAEAQLASLVDDPRGNDTRGVPLDAINAANQALHDVVNKSGLPRPVSLRFADASQMKQAGVGDAAAFEHGGSIVLGPRFKDPKAMREWIRERNNIESKGDQIARIQGQINKFKSAGVDPKTIKFMEAQVADLKVSTIATRTYAGDTAQDFIKHEYGHVLRDKLVKAGRREELSDVFDVAGEGLFSPLTDKGTKKAVNISEYATTDAGEYFAEAFTAHQKGTLASAKLSAFFGSI